MYDIPDRSAQLARLKRIEWWRSVVISTAVVLVTAVLCNILASHTPDLPPVLFIVLLFVPIPLALIGEHIADSTSTRRKSLTRYVKFYHLYNTFRQEPTLLRGDELYTYYDPFQLRHTEEDVIITNTLLECKPVLRALGVIP